MFRIHLVNLLDFIKVMFTFDLKQNENNVFAHGSLCWGTSQKVKNKKNKY